MFNIAHSYLFQVADVLELGREEGGGNDLITPGPYHTLLP